MMTEPQIDELLKIARDFLHELERYNDIQSFNVIKDFGFGEKPQAERTRIIEKIVARVK